MTRDSAPPPQPFSIGGLDVPLGPPWFPRRPQIDRDPALPGPGFAVSGLLGVAAGLMATPSPRAAGDVRRSTPTFVADYGWLGVVVRV
jgi:hypothetical protein